MQDYGTAMAFVAGIELDLLPSPFALLAFKDIARFGVAPERTADRVVRFNDWLGRNWYQKSVYALVTAGVYLIEKGDYETAT